jgi:hypothetical protein
MIKKIRGNGRKGAWILCQNVEKISEKERMEGGKEG